MISQKGWLCRKKETFYTSTFVDYTPEIIKEIRLALGETKKSWAKIFMVTEGTVKDWETPIDQNHHRKMKGPAIRIINELAGYAEVRRNGRNKSLKIFLKKKRLERKEMERRYVV